MKDTHLWNKAKELPIQTGPDIVGGFNIGFDSKISEETKDALMRFVYWVEDHFALPVTLWVDFKYNHYLVTADKQRVGYKFYWADFSTFPFFENEDDIPVIELPVRTEYSTLEEILGSFIEAISAYYIWLGNIEREIDPAEVEAVLQAYLEASV